MNTDLSLWDFSCAVYSAPDVQSACLCLQDEYHLDIPLLLFCCWSGGRYGAVSKELLQHSVDFSSDWSSRSTHVLRNLRRDMKEGYQPQWPLSKSDWEQFRNQVKAVELHSERLLLEGLQVLLEGQDRYKSAKSNNSNEQSVDNCIANIRACFQYPQSVRLSESLLVILGEIYPDCRDYIKSVI